MEIWIIILTCLFLITLIVLCVILTTDCTSSIEEYILFIIFSFIFFFILAMSINIIQKFVKPIDFYRNKTELKITSINSTPIDSVVVFKSK